MSSILTDQANLNNRRSGLRWNPEHRRMDQPGLVRCKHLMVQSAVKHHEASAKWRNHSGWLTEQIPWPLP